MCEAINGKKSTPLGRRREWRGWTCCRGLALSALISMGAATAIAHHSYGSFDLTRRETMHGRIRAIEWTNPHVWIWVDSSEAKQTYAFETVSPGELKRFFAWTKDSLAVGEEVTVEYAPLRSGKQGGGLRKIDFMDGRTLETPLSKSPLSAPPQIKEIRHE